MPEAAAGDHRHRHPRRRHQGCEAERDLVAHPAGGVLVDLGCGDVAQIDDLSECSMDWVSAAVSLALMPRKKTAMQKAVIW